MNIFDKFFTKFSYKFDKGYPDMDNPKDVLLLESLLSNLLDEKFISGSSKDIEDGYIHFSGDDQIVGCLQMVITLLKQYLKKKEKNILMK